MPTENDDDDSLTIVGKLRRARERVQRAETSRRAKRRATARRIEREEPESLKEQLAVKTNRAKEATAEVRKLAGDTREFASTTLGLDGDSDDDGSSLLSTIDDLNTEGLDEPLFDAGDGDDFGTVDPVDPVESEAGEMGTGPVEAVDAVDSPDQPLDERGVEESLFDE